MYLEDVLHFISVCVPRNEAQLLSQNMHKPGILHIVSYMSRVCKLTVFSGLDVQDVTADTVSCLCVGQNLNAVIGELLQALQLHLLTSGGDVLHLAPF